VLFLDLWRQLPGATAQGLIWGIMAVGVFLTFRLLDIADLTVDGSFCTGGAVCVMLILGGVPAWQALLVAFFAGLLAGFATGFFHTFCGISPILAGILTQLGLWSVNLRIMGKANQAVNVNNHELLVSLRYLQETGAGQRPFYDSPIFVVGLYAIVLILLLYWFFGTEIGAAIRATGANQHMARAQGINTNIVKVFGLMLSNGLVALSGGLLAQYQGFADINMGRGAIVIGLAAVIIGEVLFSRLVRNFALRLLGVVLGSVVYYVVIQVILWTKQVDPNDLKLFSALVVALFLSLPYWKGKYFARKLRKEGLPHA
jgi:putative ABC transport system permease protein